VELSDEWVAETWGELLATVDASLAAAAILYVVRGEHDLTNVEAAYYAPNAQGLQYQVLRSVGEQQLHEANGLHRFALFQMVADGPLAGFAAMLRHELRHAEQFHEFGPGLFELDGHLRAALGVRGLAAEREEYEAIPLEYDANRAAAAYAATRAEEREAMADDVRFAAYTHSYEPWGDHVLERTKAAVDEHVGADEEWNGRPVSVDIVQQHAAALAWNARDRSFDQYNRTRDGEPVVFL
jgi:hypothetical protein